MLSSSVVQPIHHMWQMEVYMWRRALILNTSKKDIFDKIRCFQFNSQFSVKYNSKGLIREGPGYVLSKRFVVFLRHYTL
jgi:hypothetical protein